jgi:hypothetical protein
VTEVVFVRFRAPLQWKSKFYRTDDNYRIFTQMKSKLNYSQPEYLKKQGTIQRSITYIMISLPGKFILPK